MLHHLLLSCINPQTTVFSPSPEQKDLKFLQWHEPCISLHLSFGKSKFSFSSIDDMTLEKAHRVRTDKMSRCRVLETCGASFLAIVHIISTRMQEVKGPIGSMSQKMANFCACAFPCTNGIQNQWLIVLSLADDCFLKSGRIAEVVFPPSARVFDKIDELARATKGLPRKFEEGLDKFPMILHQVPFLDWALVHLIAWLNFLISALSHWGNRTTREKEITVVMSSNNNNNNAESESESTGQTPATNAEPEPEDVCPTTNVQSESTPEPAIYTSLVVPILALQSKEPDKKSFTISSPESSTSGSTLSENTDSSFMNDSPPSITDSIGSTGGKCSYKEVLTKGVKEDSETEDNNIPAEPQPPESLQISKENREIPVEENNEEVKKQSIMTEESVKPMVFEAKGGDIPRGKIMKKKKKGKAEKDQILRLFDASWSLS